MKKLLLIAICVSLILFLINFLVPLSFTVPVKGADRGSYDQQSFWAYPWGTSGHHKGVDIFARKGTPVVAATSGIVAFTGVWSKGGNFVFVLDRSLKFHYYAHLDEIETSKFSWVSAGEQIGTVGNTGNAKGKPPHLHYAISRVIPKWESEESWTKRFYDDPVKQLNKAMAKQ